MKTIAELKKSATVLDRKALKSLLGGAGCAAGENKYACSVTDDGGSYGGYVCSTSANNARLAVREATYDTPHTVSCGPA
jgi:hypothetical protein